MVDWKSPDVIALCGFIFNQSMILMLGIYIWEFVLSFPHIDLALIRRKLKFRWMFVPYLAGRYGHLGTQSGLILYINTSTGAWDCAALGRIFSVFGAMTIACASTNLLVRTLIIWRESRAIFWCLIFAALCQWVTCITTGAAPRVSVWDPKINACQYDSTPVLIFYFYTVALDFAIVVLTVVGLRRVGVWRGNVISMALLEHGIGYFVVTAAVNLPVLVLANLDLNNVMAMMTTIPAATISVICSSRAVMALVNLRDSDSKRAPGEFTSYKIRRTGDKDSKRDMSEQMFTTNIVIPNTIHSGCAAEASPSRCASTVAAGDAASAV
ncbi:hypothetical protein BXZ70DRAFT_696379 [Cristinia sonorae]|uniref:Uncharacterized protein n=1 Tax=Cristinia sonorae TaxID=1940300 RepID=A0A8K0UDQ2_9AGAR|nr:hypothetical protein BXZ70DRAFT_696379 [Cristinia sonorae]